MKEKEYMSLEEVAQLNEDVVLAAVAEILEEEDKGTAKSWSEIQKMSLEERKAWWAE